MSGDRASWTRRASRAVVRRLPLLGTLLGLGLATWLVATNDLGAVAAAFGRIGMAGFVGVTLVRALVVIVCGIAWARILDGLSPAPSSACLILRFVREGINVLLPVASVGGDVLGARLLTFWGVAGSLAAASVLADMLFQVGTLGPVRRSRGRPPAARSKGPRRPNSRAGRCGRSRSAGLALAAFFALQRTRRSCGVVEERLAALGRRFVRETETRPEPGRRIQGALDAVWAPGRRRARSPQSFVLHAPGLDRWARPRSSSSSPASASTPSALSEILVIEALSQAIKSAAFPVPSGLGVQEGGFVLVCGLFGIDAGTAIALSLASRVPDVVLGLPALLVWQNLEARRGQRAPRAPRACDRP